MCFLKNILLRHISQSVSNKYKNISQTSEVHQTEMVTFVNLLTQFQLQYVSGCNRSTNSTRTAIIVDIAQQCLRVTMLFYT